MREINTQPNNKGIHLEGLLQIQLFYIKWGVETQTYNTSVPVCTPVGVWSICGVNVCGGVSLCVMYSCGVCVL